MDDAFGHWLAGFIDGEGCFYVNRMKTAYQPRFTVKLRVDDAAILHEIVERTGLGYVKGSYYAQPGRANKPQAEWHVISKADCRGLVELLDRFPLRAKKARDYALWRRVVILWSEMKQASAGRLGRLPYDWGEIPELHRQIIAGRRFDSVPA